MSANTTGTQIEPWKVRLVTRRARRAGFRGADLEDVQQEIVLDVLSFQFDRSRSNGATEATALTALIDRRASALRRSKRRYEKRFDRSVVSAELADLAVHDRHREDAQLLALDVCGAVEQLSAEDRLVCEALAEGFSIAEVAKRRGCSWHTVGRQVARIRQWFEALGLDQWLSEGG